MNIESPEIIFYILINFVTLLTIYNFIRIFLNKKPINKKICLISYLVYYIFSILILFMGFSQIYVLLLDIVGLILIMFNYKTSIMLKISCAIFVYAILLFCEFLVLNYLNLSNIEILRQAGYGTYGNEILILVLAVIFLEILKKFDNGKSVFKLINLYILLVVAISLIFSIAVINPNALLQKNILIYIILIFALITSSLYIYSRVIYLFNVHIKNGIIEKQNKYYEELLATINNFNKNSKSIKHDYQNHLLAIKTMVDQNKNVELKKYMEEICKRASLGEKIAFTENILIDSILNFKIDEISNKNIKYEFNINIPKDLQIEYMDLTIILSNLIDNAIEATNRETNNNEKYIILSLKVKDNIFIIKCENSFDGVVKTEQGKIITRKNNILDSGIGMFNIKNVIEKYKGLINIKYDDKKFATAISLILKENEEVNTKKG